MGRTVNAYLAYGVNVTSEHAEALPWGFGEDNEENPKPSFEDWAAEISDLTNPCPDSEIKDDDSTWSAWYEVPANKRNMQEYWRKKAELAESLPIQEVVYNHEDRELLVAVRGTVSVAGWTEPIKPKIEVDEASLSVANEFCKQHDISFLNPDWILVAYSDS